MPYCAAVGCTNCTEKGYLMKVFPRDPARRYEWVRNVKRPNWIPTNNSYLCHVSSYFRQSCHNFTEIVVPGRHIVSHLFLFRFKIILKL